MIEARRIMSQQTPQLSELPMLCTPKVAAEVMGLTAQQVRSLLRLKKIAHVPVGKRLMIPRSAIENFIAQNTVLPCHVEIPERAYASLKSADAITSSGLNAVAAGSAARALQIASKLKSPLPNSSQVVSKPAGHVIPLRSS
jgi:excisionase family DNA binding protein